MCGSAHAPLQRRISHSRMGLMTHKRPARRRTRRKQVLPPDKVWKQFARRKFALTTELIAAERGAAQLPDVLLDGSKASLECLASVILAVANDQDCGYEFSPKGPGSAYFSLNAELGVCIHRLPCVNQKVGGKPFSAVTIPLSKLLEIRTARPTAPVPAIDGR
jgi:hypothetical protein